MEALLLHLFILQDLMSRLVKDLPPDPIEFLISKLQGVHQQRKKVINLAGQPHFPAADFTVRFDHE